MRNVLQLKTMLPDSLRGELPIHLQLLMSVTQNRIILPDILQDDLPICFQFLRSVTHIHTILPGSLHADLLIRFQFPRSVTRSTTLLPGKRGCYRLARARRIRASPLAPPPVSSPHPSARPAAGPVASPPTRLESPLPTVPMTSTEMVCHAFDAASALCKPTFDLVLKPHCVTAHTGTRISLVHIFALYPWVVATVPWFSQFLISVRCSVPNCSMRYQHTRSKRHPNVHALFY